MRSERCHCYRQCHNCPICWILRSRNREPRCHLGTGCGQGHSHLESTRRTHAARIGIPHQCPKFFRNSRPGRAYTFSPNGARCDRIGRLHDTDFADIGHMESQNFEWDTRTEQAARSQLPRVVEWLGIPHHQGDIEDTIGDPSYHERRELVGGSLAERPARSSDKALVQRSEFTAEWAL